jgi:hypothetical protein
MGLMVRGLSQTIDCVESKGPTQHIGEHKGDTLYYHDDHEKEKDGCIM